MAIKIYKNTLLNNKSKEINSFNTFIEAENYLEDILKDKKHIFFFIKEIGNIKKSKEYIVLDEDNYAVNFFRIVEPL